MTTSTVLSLLVSILLVLPYNVIVAFTPSSPHLAASTSQHSCVRKSSGLFLSQGDNSRSNRRDVLNGFAAMLLSGVTITTSSQAALVFDNKINNKYDDRPKRRGPQPKDLGVRIRKDMVGEEYNGLKPCGPAPNCFCSTDDIQDDPEHNIPSWKYPSSLDKENAFVTLENVINAYKPGQGNIDGGGFKIIESNPKKGYLYAQFESLKNGYIDDVEFAYIDGQGDNVVQVRSSSRVGYLDFQVNSKRLNAIAKSLRSDGWDAPGVDPSTHQDYFAQNSSS